VLVIAAVQAIAVVAITVTVAFGIKKLKR